MAQLIILTLSALNDRDKAYDNRLIDAFHLVLRDLKSITAIGLPVLHSKLCFIAASLAASDALLSYDFAKTILPKLKANTVLIAMDSNFVSGHRLLATGAVHND